jgi:hypothetical protein
MSRIITALLFGLVLSAASVPAATYAAASCAESDVQTALRLAAAGDTVQIPAGTCTWTTTLTYQAPGSITIIGASSQSVTGGGDATVIIDNVSHSPSDDATFAITTGPASSVFRLSGLTFQGGTGGTTYSGVLRIGGTSQNFRMDHIHFKVISAVAADIDGWIYGVVDHCLWDMAPNSVDNGLRIGHVAWGGYQYGDGSWADTTTFGSNRFIFMEDNVFNNGFANDINNGGRMVFRHNTLTLSEFQTHEMEDRNRASRAWEVYANNFTCDPNVTAACGSSALFVRGGTGLVWANTANNIKNLITANNDRTNTGHAFVTPPNGWGYCGTTYGPSAWDQNTDSSGYPCIDQIGRGKGDLLPQSYWPVTPFWSHEASEPIYEWNDTVAFAPNWGGVKFSQDLTINPNRDFYSSVSPFTGAAGTGTGLLSARPTVCTPYVAYWATDTNTLYQCSATNTWTSYYTPYTYPHPLVANSGGGTNTPLAPTNLTLVVR